MAEKYYETRHIFMAIGICILVCSPVLLVFVPQDISNTVHFSKGLWYVFTPGDDYAVYAIGCFLLFVSSMLLFLLDIKKISIIISLILASVAIACFFVASQSYESISDDSLSYSPLFSQKDYTYSWNQLKSVTLFLSQREGNSRYKFVFTDGNSMTLRDDKYFRVISPELNYKLKQMDLEIKIVQIT